ncbi:MAG: 23S rRNA (guanosine(2251)-2'-O)-methyltransferase RlmB [Candidatus Nanoarchaeia archaeon]|nr:23S rRNA (guanosine(2251)-2'-O)-methyltransferase RlmB [Candidatus Omnitrophota bacterium]MDD5417540.1 23S rRNA (guanosine(2251)-2'-O)-methyltransferase RlmB [Candidatus Nanoarchaeia archaeon]
MYIMLYGKNPILESLKAGKRKLYRIFIYEGIKKDSKLKEILYLAKEKDVKVKYVSRKQLSQLSESKNHQGIIAKAGGRSQIGLRRILKLKNPLVLILEGIKDPRNYGSIIRTAETAGVNALVVPEKDFAPLNTDAIKASTGATEYINIIKSSNTTKTAEYLKERGFMVIGADMDGEVPYTDIKYKGPVAVVLGGEDTGLKRITKQRCDFIVRIPVQGKVTSLNVSVSAGIILYEIVRQRNS